MRRSVCLLLILLVAVANGQKQKAPDFTLSGLNGKQFRLADHLGKGPILINFWATWCIPCKLEMKALKKLYRKYHRKGLQIISIAIDDPKTVEKVRVEARIKKYPFLILLDTNSEVFHLYGGVNPPLTVLLDKHGYIVYSHDSYRKGDEHHLEQEIIPLLEKE